MNPNQLTLYTVRPLATVVDRQEYSLRGERSVPQDLDQLTRRTVDLGSGLGCFPESVGLDQLTL